LSYQARRRRRRRAAPDKYTTPSRRAAACYAVPRARRCRIAGAHASDARNLPDAGTVRRSDESLFSLWWCPANAHLSPAASSSRDEGGRRYHQRRQQQQRARLRAAARGAEARAVLLVLVLLLVVAVAALIVAAGCSLLGECEGGAPGRRHRARAVGPAGDAGAGRIAGGLSLRAGACGGGAAAGAAAGAARLCGARAVYLLSRRAAGGGAGARLVGSGSLGWRGGWRR